LIEYLLGYGNFLMGGEFLMPCQKCHEGLVLDIRDLDVEAIIKRWEALSRPALDRSWLTEGGFRKPKAEVANFDFRNWARTVNLGDEDDYLMLTYMAQQLWPQLSACFLEAKRGWRKSFD
jgi:hypothetical protein